jgi:hypothetical protein
VDSGVVTELEFAGEGPELNEKVVASKRSKIGCLELTHLSFKALYGKLQGLPSLRRIVLHPPRPSEHDLASVETQVYEVIDQVGKFGVECRPVQVVNRNFVQHLEFPISDGLVSGSPNLWLR